MAQLKSTLIEKVQTALISIATAAIVGCCTFMFKVHGALSRIEQNISNEIVLRNNQDIKVNRHDVEISDLKIVTTRIETKQNQKPN